MPSKHIKAHELLSTGVFSSINSFQDFERRVAKLVDKNTKMQGDVFEIFVEAYLSTQPLYMCSDVWLVGDIPVKIRDDLNLPSDAKGIDGVFRTTLGELVPYQAKFRANRRLGFGDVATFLGISENAKDRILITNCDSIQADILKRNGVRVVGRAAFDSLTEQDFVTIERWLYNERTPRKKACPMPHQAEALEKIENHLRCHDRATLIMACGTGKTLVSMWAAERTSAKTILVMLPSLTLLQQTLTEWSANNSWGSDFSYFCVCSDPQVDLQRDEIRVESSELPFRVNTDAGSLRAYLSSNKSVVKVVFSTYQSSEVVVNATKDWLTFDFGVFDEAHKTTGTKGGLFGRALSNENIAIQKRIFLTATPKHYHLKKRDSFGELRFTSMEDREVYGEVIYKLKFGEAAKKGIVCPYKVVISVIDKKQIDDFAFIRGVASFDDYAENPRWVASQVALVKAMEHTRSSKIISFHGRVSLARRFSLDKRVGIGRFDDGLQVYHVNGGQKSGDRRDTLKRFEVAPRSLISNARCLTEGVDVPSVDMVAFIDPRASKVDISQAVGRAMRRTRDSNKEVGYIFLPILSDDISEASITEAIGKEGFDQIATVLNALMEQDEDLLEIIHELKFQKGKGEVFDSRRVREKIEVIGPQMQIRDLEESIFVHTVDQLGESWYESFGRLVKFWSTEGHTNVHQNCIQDGFRLGGWVSKQREAHKSLSNERRRKLDEIGFVWNARDWKWDQGIRCLRSFRDRVGNCLVPQNHLEGGFKLGQWVGTVRYNWEDIDEGKKTELLQLGFERSAFDAKWQTRYSELVNYFNREGNSNVPVDYVAGEIKLGQWVNQQRTNEPKLSVERRQLLNDLNFVWDPTGLRWDIGMAALIEFYSQNGHSKVPRNYKVNGYGLGFWVQHLRGCRPSLNEEQIQSLSEVGFSFSLNEGKWEEGLRKLKTYKALFGNCLVPQRYMMEGFKLGYWVANLRKRQNSAALDPDRVKVLEDLGFVWEARKNDK
jgi:superfamily II DNA or RNA helicase